MNLIDNEIRVFEKDGEKYAIVNDLVRVLKIKNFSQWMSNKKRANPEINFIFYDGIYLVPQNIARTLIKESRSITRFEKESLLNQLEQVDVPKSLKPKEEEKYEFVLSKDAPFLHKESVSFFMKKKGFSYSDLKREAGWSSKTELSQYFNGWKKPSLGYLKKMAKALGTIVSFIVISADEASDEMKANYQRTREREAESKNKKSNTPRTVINVTKEAVISSLNKIDDIKVSMQHQFEAQQEQLETQQKRLKILQAQLEDIEHESAYLRDALVGNSNQVDEDDYWEE